MVEGTAGPNREVVVGGASTIGGPAITTPEAWDRTRPPHAVVAPARAPLDGGSSKPRSRTRIMARLLIDWGDLARALNNRFHVRTSHTFGESVSAGAGKRRSIALTFDDGPSVETAELLDYLASEGIRATFFQCGLNILRNPGTARRVHEEGHELGNHTFSHARLCPQVSRQPNWRTPQNIYRELAETQKILKSITGTDPTLFRPPYGLRWFGLGKAQRRLGLLGVRWTVIGHDWEWPADRVADFVLTSATPGGIICLHDGRDIQPMDDHRPLLEALRLIIPALKAQGYIFETVSELLTPDHELHARTFSPRVPV